MYCHFNVGSRASGDKIGPYMEELSAVDSPKVWSRILSDIKEDIGEQRFNLWIGHTKLVSFDSSRVEIGVPNLFVQEWLEGRFKELFANVCAAHVGAKPEVCFVIHGKLFKDSRRKALKAQEDIVVAGARQGVARSHARIHSDFLIDNFVVGPSNKLAHATAVQLIQGDGAELSPLFFHSGSGLGKTHLLQAILWGVRKAQDGRTVEYVAAEEFTNQFVYAMRRGKLDAFRHKYRKVDVLFIDDVQFFCEKAGLQEEFLHTFDVLAAENKQIVMASDVHPKMMKSLKESLASRFGAGMVVRIGRPDFTTRVEVLKAKARQHHRRISEDVLRYIARGFEGNIRELSGALMTVIAYASLLRSKISMSLAREALNEIDSDTRQVVDMAAIEKSVSVQFGVSVQDLHSRRRTKAIALPRQVCMHLARELTSLSCAEIARHFGGKHHTTVVFGQRRVLEQCRKSRELGDTVAALKERLLGR